MYILAVYVFISWRCYTTYNTGNKAKGKSPNSSYKKTKDAKFSKKLIFLTECIKG